TFFPALVRAVQQASSEFGAEVVLMDSEGSAAAEEDLVHRIRPQVDGLIIASPRLPTGRLRAMLSGIPSVILNRAVQGLPTVVVDNSIALRQAAAHLYDLGHRHFALLRGPANTWAATRRAQAVYSCAEVATPQLHE